MVKKQKQSFPFGKPYFQRRAVSFRGVIHSLRLTARTWQEAKHPFQEGLIFQPQCFKCHWMFQDVSGRAHPPRQTWNVKIDPWKGDSYWKPSFPGSMLVFGGCISGSLALPFLACPKNIWSPSNDSLSDSDPMSRWLPVPSWRIIPGLVSG